MTWLEEDIVRFDIPVKDVTFVKRVEGIDQLPEDWQGFFLWQGSPLSKQVFQGASLTELIHQVDIVAALDHLYKFHDVEVFF